VHRCVSKLLAAVIRQVLFLNDHLQILKSVIGHHNRIHVIRLRCDYIFRIYT
jgi:hypothetical protein